MINFHTPLSEIVSLPVDEKFLRIVGMGHDFGKYTTFFQEYLKSGRRDKNNLHRHGELGAYFTAWWLEREGYDPLQVLIGYLAVLNHHGALKVSFGCDDPDFDCGDFRYRWGRWLADLKENTGLISEEIGVNIGFFLSFGTIQRLGRRLMKTHLNVCEDDLTPYFTVAYVFSLLIDADKKDASGTRIPGRKGLPKDMVERYRRERFKEAKNEINRKRNRLYNDVMGNLKSLEEIPPVLSINAPTGMGKTLVNLSVALHIRHHLEKGLGYRPRIIYSLPFTSIIDQTYEVFEDVFKTTLKGYEDEPESYLLKHHHLAEITYRRGGEEEPLDRALLLVESWESEVIITTFVQLLETVIGTRNAYLKKFHNMAGSIVILDEVQNIDVKYWETVRKVMDFMAENLGVKFILSTATKPMLYPEAYELVSNYDSYVVPRTVVISKPEIREESDLKSIVLNGLERGASSYMVVLNTINSSVSFYNFIKEEARRLGYESLYLSTNVVPFHRQGRIAWIRRMLERGEKVLLVSTQVVEAGVDLDFEEVVRDIGPLDSIVQVAGRCNRNARADRGKVSVVALRDGRGRLLSSLVYGAVLTDISLKILEKHPKIYEEEFHRITDEYFSIIQERTAQSEYWKHMCKLAYEEVGRFSLIEERPDYVEVFVQTDERAKEVWNRFVEEVLKERELNRRRLNYLKLRRKVRSYIISVPKVCATRLPEEGDIRYVPLEELTTYYDPDTGFRRKDCTGGFEVW